MKKSQILRAAKAVLWGGTPPYRGPERTPKFVCTAVQRFDSDNARELRVWIMRLLRSDTPQVTTLEGWLSVHHRVNHPNLTDELPAYELRMQTTRHAWLDWMIAYWEERGD